MNVTGKRILVTGAGGGIGAAVVRELAKAGAQLVLCGRDQVALDTLRRTLPNPDVHNVCCFDVSASIDVINEKIKTCQPFDVLINNAGCSTFAWLEDQQGDEIAQQINVNLRAPILLTQAALLYINKGGVIVNMGSCFGAIGYPGYSVYCASKFGLRGFSESMDRELSGSGMRVLYVAPRATATGLNDARVDGLNTALGNTVDDPIVVAQHVLAAITREKNINAIGFPEKLFVKINALLPAVVANAINSKLNVIKKYAKSSGDRK